MSVACNHCGAAVQLSSTSVIGDALPNNGDPLMPFVKAQMKDLKVQNANLVTENESLSAKLIESTEARTDLDAQLNATQMELQAAQSQIKTLKNNQIHYEQLMTMISNGQLIEKKDVQPVIENLAYESQRRSQIEFSKQKLESELEDLSRTLFEEANRMVIEERQINFIASKRIEALERQLDEVLDLCKSEREQLVELKLRMEKLSEEKDTLQRERDTLDYAYHQLHHQYQLVAAASSSGPLSLHQHITTAAALRHGVASHLSSHAATAAGSISPVSPNGDRAAGGSGSLALQIESAAGSRRAVQQAMQLDLRHHQSSTASVRSKTDSCYFSDGDHPGSHYLNEANEDRIPTLGFHLWDPAFVDFKHFLESIFNSASTAQRSNISSQSGNATGSGISSLYAFSILGKQPAQTNNNNNNVIPINTLLAQSRLLKTMAGEDVEATLRFEPGNLLSWTQRKRLMTAVTDNTLVVEAVPVATNSPASPAAKGPTVNTTSATAKANGNTAATPATAARPNCALCGNNIHTPLYYQYRLTDTSNESRTICPYCRTRLTSVCTFYSVLRMLSKRIISSSTTPEKLYLDFLRIRLSMFLARCGVGVVTGDEPKQQASSSQQQQQQQQQNHHSSPNASHHHQHPPTLVKRESTRSAGETMGRNTGPSLLRESVSMYSEPAETPTTTIARKVVVVTPAVDKDSIKKTETNRPPLSAPAATTTSKDASIMA
ncbi:rab guanine nucleotide exchange factor S2 [Actinomortierella ambigua]|nr:rab guanine nucleotide exchange factor S2 [Actinomortierella ambigua]